MTEKKKRSKKRKVILEFSVSKRQKCGPVLAICQSGLPTCVQDNESEFSLLKNPRKGGQEVLVSQDVSSGTLSLGEEQESNQIHAIGLVDTSTAEVELQFVQKHFLMSSIRPGDKSLVDKSLRRNNLLKHTSA
eukprot:UN27044